jgi:hypothetical protein
MVDPVHPWREKRLPRFLCGDDMQTCPVCQDNGHEVVDRILRIHTAPYKHQFRGNQFKALNHGSSDI